MKPGKILYACLACGGEFGKWAGKCPACGEWNTIAERMPAKKAGRKSAPGAVLLSAVRQSELARIQSGSGEFNLVCGGGMVPGSVILIGGEPGIGKSTLALQIAGSFGSVYFSGEESPVQLRLRGERLGIDIGKIKISTASVVEEIEEIVRAEKPGLVIVDSIQTVVSSAIPGSRGSVSQIRESTSKLADLARETNIPVIIIGHITKEGSIAGPKLLEHLVDTVLYFEGDFSREFRMLRAFKNRFGSVNEIGLFRMAENGLAEVTDKNRIFLNPFRSPTPGNAVSAALEGSRTILFEVQSLVTFTSFSYPRRMSDGFDINRLVLIAAVLERHAGLKLNTFDVFINVSGGYRITETAADLAVAMAIASSLKNRPISEKTGLVGEISLSGEIRPVAQCERRAREFKHSGFNTLILSESDVREAKGSAFEGNLIGVKKIQEAVDYLF